MLRSFDELYSIAKSVVETQVPALTDFSEGSINDIILGISALVGQEIQAIIVDEYKKTLFSNAEGSDLDFLAEDHFGATFARPAAKKGTGVVTFSRANADEGDVVISAGSIVKTPIDASGNSQRFRTLSVVTMTGTEINASVEAVDSGVAGNVSSGKVTQIETTLTDSSVVVTNDEAFSGGAAIETDDEYRATITRLIEQLKGATLSALEAKAKNVSGVEYAKGYESLKTVIEYDDATEETSGESFRFPEALLYVADANGAANDALVALVQAAIDLVRSAGVKVTAVGATAQSFNWTASITLDAGGPNYAELSSDTTKIKTSMEDYVKNRAIGAGFDKSDADAAILAIWGPSGTGDLDAFSTSTPSGDVSGSTGVKLIPGTMTIS